MVDPGMKIAIEQFPFGPHFAQARFDTFQTPDPGQQKTLAAVTELAHAALADKRRNRPWLILSGNPGTGKSHLLASVYWHLAANASADAVKNGRHYGLPRVFFSGELFEKIRAAVYGADRRDAGATESIRAAVRQRTTGPLVIIDDYGVGLPPITAQTQTQQEITFTLFNELYNLEKPLLLATNLPIERARKGGLRLCDVLGARAWDRCLELAEIINCNWPSYRQRGNLL